MCCDIKDFYLRTPMERYEYIHLPLSIIPERIIEHYNTRAIDKNGNVYADIIKGMYGLPWSGRIANNFLTKNIAPSE